MNRWSPAQLAEFALLFRDFLRADPAAAQDYGQRKLALATTFRYDRLGYLEAKIPIIWDVLRRADQWAQETGWEPGPSDA
ncbi:MAG TPA: GrpB family protein [Actinomycetes bacterium]|nr:GrpB family protein [Actinomycetes bacterium]